jgi:sec-independent protein translocase protein TatC
MASDTKAGAEMPFLDHLEELRWRIIWSLVALAAGMVIGFGLVAEFDVIGLLVRPIAPLLHGGKLIYTHPGDPFGIMVEVAFAIGIVLAAPVILYQAWAFVAPALHAHEKRTVMPVIGGAVVLFVAGVSLAYFIVLPISLRFLLGLQTASLQSLISAADYFGFAVGMSLAFGVAFELPIVIVALTALGIVTPQILNRYRRHAIVVVVVIAAVVVPGQDVTSMFALAVPLYLLYELSILLSYGIWRNRERRRLGGTGGGAGAPAGPLAPGGGEGHHARRAWSA